MISVMASDDFGQEISILQHTDYKFTRTRVAIQCKAAFNSSKNT